MTAPVRFAGYAAIFDSVDKGGDVITPGAFAHSLQRRGGQGVPLLWQHRADQPIGRIEAVSEDERGLRVIGEIAGAARWPGRRRRCCAMGGSMASPLAIGWSRRRARSRGGWMRWSWSR